MLSYLIALIYAGIWVPEFFTATDNHLEPWSFAATSILSGLMTVYLAFLAIGDFQKVFYLCHVLGAVSALWLIYKARIGKLEPVLLPWSRVNWGLLALTAMIVFAILFTGISDWQARSVWFFQAKILHHTGTLNAPDWHNPLYSFAFAAYPKMFPVIIAFVTSPWDGWNEYVPKWCEVLFLIPVVASLLALELATATRVFLFLALTGIAGDSLWNGSPEGYGAIFFAMGLLNFAVFQRTRGRGHLLQAVLFLGLLPSFSPEGGAMVLCALLALSFFHFGGVKIFDERNVIKFAVIPAGAFIFWQLRKLEFHYDDTVIIHSSTWARLFQRVIDIKPFLLVARNTILAHLPLLFFVGLLAIYFRLPMARAAGSPRWQRREHSWILATAGIYFVFLVLIYGATPFDVQWYASAHLPYAALVVKFTVLAYLALGLEPVAEDDDSTSSISRDARSTRLRTP